MSSAAKDDLIMMCSFHAGGGLFGIDTRQIREVLGAVKSQPVPLAPAYIDGVVAYRGEMLTTLSLRVLLGLERRADAGCVLVLDDEQNEERFGLVVDDVGGVLMLSRKDFEPNPSTLDERRMDIFDGTCRSEAGLLVRLDSTRLRPARLGESGIYGSARQRRPGERR